MESSSDELVRLIRQRSKRIRPLPAAGEEAGRLPHRPTSVLFDVYGTLLVRLSGPLSRPRPRRRRADDVVASRLLPLPHPALELLVAEAVARQNSARNARGVLHPKVVIERIWARLFPGLSSAELRRAIVEQELAIHPAWPMPGCRSLLRSLSRRGIALVRLLVRPRSGQARPGAFQPRDEEAPRSRASRPRCAHGGRRL